MIKPRILVTGATGKTGGIVVTELLKAGYPVRAMVRLEDGGSARLTAQGAEIAVAEMSDVERRHATPLRGQFRRRKAPSSNDRA